MTSSLLPSPPAPPSSADQAAPVTMQREPMTEALLDEALPLLTAHWREVAHYQDIPLDVDRGRYLAFDAAGASRVFTCRRDTALLGYAVFIVQRNAHYRGSLQAVQDVVYLDPAVRGGTGARFIRFCDRELGAEGVQAVYHHVKAAKNFGPLLERLGYELVDLIYAKRLD